MAKKNNRVRRVQSEVELATFPEHDAALLMQFNLSKQRIVDLCNAELEDDVLLDERDYSTYNRALNGLEVWEGIVLSLDSLLEMQIAYPWKYIDMTRTKDLRKDMKRLAKAPWWYDTLGLTMSQSSFNAWFAGRTMGKNKIAEVQEKYDNWHGRMESALNDARDYTMVIWADRRDLRDRIGADSWDTFIKDMLDAGMEIEQARAKYTERADKYDAAYLTMIDPADPVSPLRKTSMKSKLLESIREDRQDAFDAMVKEGFPKAKPMPVATDEVYYRKGKWGDRRDEEGPVDHNTYLYGLYYREKCQDYVDEVEREICVNSEIVSVSKDGQEWLPADERHKRGWINGFDDYILALDAGKDTSNQYTQAVEAARVKVRQLRQQCEMWSNRHKYDELQAELVRADKALEDALNNTGL